MDPTAAMVLITIYSTNMMTAKPQPDMDTCMLEAKRITEIDAPKLTATYRYPYRMHERNYSEIKQETRTAYTAYCVPGYVTGEQ